MIKDMERNGMWWIVHLENKLYNVIVHLDAMITYDNNVKR
jgi:hypothetical protein